MEFALPTKENAVGWSLLRQLRKMPLDGVCSAI